MGKLFTVRYEAMIAFCDYIEVNCALDALGSNAKPNELIIYTCIFLQNLWQLYNWGKKFKNARCIQQN